jgi:hypothetical protein
VNVAAIMNRLRDGRLHLVYLNDKSEISVTPADGKRAAAILSEHSWRVIGAYDERVTAEDLTSDIEYSSPQLAKAA